MFRACLPRSWTRQARETLSAALFWLISSWASTRFAPLAAALPQPPR